MKTNGTIWTAILIVAMWLANLIWGDALVEVMPGILNTAGEIAAAAVSLVGLAVTAWAEVRKERTLRGDNEYWARVSGERSVNWTQIPPSARSVNWTGGPVLPLWRRVL